MKFKPALILYTLTLCHPALDLFAQTYSPPTRMPSTSNQAAGINQDLALLKQQLGEMRLELERLVRLNNSLETRLKAMEERNANSLFITESFFNRELASLRAEFNKLNKVQKEEIIAQVSLQIRALAEETEKSIQSIVDGSTAPTTVKVVEFSNNYPKMGIYYKVKSGDSLSKIAKEAGSKISYIINANKIPEPDQLQVGKELFVPIDNPN